MSVYKQPNSDVWWVSITHPNAPRVRRSTGTTDRVEAQRVHDEIKAALWNQPKLKGKTWGMAVTAWTEEGRDAADIYRLFKFARYFPDRALTDITGESLETALKFCKTPGTYNRYRGMLMSVLSTAKQKKWLREVPDIAVRKAKKKPRMWITREQWAKLYAELPPHQQAMAEFAIETGLRQANVLGLTWDRVDLERRLVWVEAEEMKGDRAVGIPLSDGAINVLRNRVGTHPEFVFTYRGQPIKEIKTAFQAACVRAGVGSISDKGLYTGFTWHSFRHTWATWHIQGGTPVEVLQKLGAWADLRMVMNYAHHSPGHLASFANNAANAKPL